jgi:ribosomal protein S27E
MSALTTHTFGKQREKETEKKQINRNFNKRSKAEKGKEQDRLKKISLEPLRQGQRLDTSETKSCSSKEHKPPKHTRAPPAHMQAPPEQVPTLGTNRSGRFSKPVRPVPPSRPYPQKPKKQKKCPNSSLTLGIGSRDAKQLFSTFLSPPCYQCMNQGSNLKICNLELLKYTKFFTRCYTCPNEQVRYSTAS